MPAKKAASQDPRRYSEGEGYAVGNAAPADLYLNEDDKVVKTAPERGTVLTIKGSPVTPDAAAVLDAHKFTG